MSSAKIASLTSVASRAHHAAAASGPAAAGRLDAGELAERREEVDLRDERLGDAAAVEAAGPAHDQHHAEAAVGQRRLGARERSPWSVVRITSVSSARSCSSSALSTAPTPWSSERALAL